MLIASIAMVMAGIFCVANASAAFLTVAFVVGAVLLIIGLCEIVIGRRADFVMNETGIGLTKDGVRSLIVGIVVISGQITDDTVAVMLFGLYLTFEGVFSFKTDWLDLRHASGEQRVNMTVSALMLILGIYMLFNMSLLRLPVIMLIGLFLILMGFRRFLQSFKIEYIRPSFITGNEEKLLEAQEEEKRALAKAKEGIREQKAAQRRIRKIEEDIAAEESLVLDAKMRKIEREEEEKLAEN